MKVKKRCSLMPLRDVVIFPYMVSPLFVGRDSSIKALEYALSNNKKIILVSQKTASQEDPSPDDINKVGVLASILQMMRLPDNTVKVLVEGSEIVSVDNIKKEQGFYMSDASEYTLDDTKLASNMLTMKLATLKATFKEYVRSYSDIDNEVYDILSIADAPDKFIYTIAASLRFSLERRQELLEQSSLDNLIEMLQDILDNEIDLKKVDKKIKSRVKKQIDKSQRDYYLNEKIKAIHKELGSSSLNQDEEIEDLKVRISESGMSAEAVEKMKKELNKLKQMSPTSAEANVIRTYIESVLDLPWEEESEINDDIIEAEKILSGDHYGLEEVKERILEYLAVQQRVGKIKGPILCLVGPPGVGKTSLGKSIAKSTGRKFVRMSLGGVRDGSDIRGHRRTYIGSMPGGIIQNISKVGVKNPLFLLDEIDKMSAGFHGDPGAALLEVLDPEQNNSFNDHYLEVDYDLSNVMFVATSNSMDIPGPLLDRMEVIKVSSYTEDEKFNICKLHLVNKQREKHGLSKTEFKISDASLMDMIQHYTREAGVRGLDRELAKLMRKSVTMLAKNNDLKSVSISKKNIEDFLGVRKFRHGVAEKVNKIGQVTGLAWTSLGGELLTIEAVVMPGTGKFTITGQLGNVMQESIQAAMSVIRSRANSIGIQTDFSEKYDIHVHVPEGATPKDGPSAGVGMCTALISVLTGIKVKSTVAMTGEITLRGEVLPIGGLKEKMLAAHRGGIKTVLIPHENKKDLADIPDNVLETIRIVPVKWIDDVWQEALVSLPKPIVTNDKSDNATKSSSEVRAH